MRFSSERFRSTPSGRKQLSRSSISGSSISSSSSSNSISSSISSSNSSSSMSISSISSSISISISSSIIIIISSSSSSIISSSSSSSSISSSSSSISSSSSGHVCINKNEICKPEFVLRQSLQRPATCSSTIAALRNTIISDNRFFCVDCGGAGLMMLPRPIPHFRTSTCPCQRPQTPSGVRGIRRMWLVF
ncbi:hypothetical protein FHG87_023757 [Trinorchestia longiramus]|nr:hypothetical protein FHG87_023757 [Trinorchestia longiramus]